MLYYKEEKSDIMNELTKEEVLHVADLAKIEVDEKDIIKYKVELKQIMNQIDLINKVNIDEEGILISPSNNKNIYREDVFVNEDIDILKNAPKSNGNYIEIKRFLNE